MIKKTPAYLSVLMAGLLAVAGAHAQSTPASGSSDGPPAAGEASTQTLGAPNAKTTNEATSEMPAMSKDAIRQDAQGRDAAAATTRVPGRAGEASTTVAGKPNADPNAMTQARTRAEVRGELLASRKNFEDTRRAMRNPDQRLGVTGTATTSTTAPATN
jgi:hypothetical protein